MMWRGIQIGGVRDVRRTRIWRVGGVCVGRVIVRGRDADYDPNVESEVRSRLCMWCRGRGHVLVRRRDDTAV